MKDARKAPTGMLIFPVGIFMVYCGPYKGFVGMGSVGRGVTVLDAGGKSDDRGDPKEQEGKRL